MTQIVTNSTLVLSQKLSMILTTTNCFRFPTQMLYSRISLSIIPLSGPTQTRLTLKRIHTIEVQTYILITTHQTYLMKKAMRSQIIWTSHRSSQLIKLIPTKRENTTVEDPQSFLIPFLKETDSFLIQCNMGMGIPLLIRIQLHHTDLPTGIILTEITAMIVRMFFSSLCKICLILSQSSVALSRHMVCVVQNIITNIFIWLALL